jgi:hypothetical protein
MTPLAAEPRYNNDHRHSGIGLHTPATVHDGTAWAIQARRQQVLDDAYAARPDASRTAGRKPRPGPQGMDQPAPPDCPVTTQIARSSSLTCTEESSLTIHGGQGARFARFK